MYEHPYMGWTYHIIIHQADEIPDLNHHMLCPIQVCTNSGRVNDSPIFLTNHPTEENHYIVVDDEWGDIFILPL